MKSGAGWDGRKCSSAQSDSSVLFAAIGLGTEWGMRAAALIGGFLLVGVGCWIEHESFKERKEQRQLEREKLEKCKQQ